MADSGRDDPDACSGPSDRAKLIAMLNAPIELDHALAIECVLIRRKQLSDVVGPDGDYRFAYWASKIIAGELFEWGTEGVSLEAASVGSILAFMKAEVEARAATAQQVNRRALRYGFPMVPYPQLQQREVDKKNSTQ